MACEVSKTVFQFSELSDRAKEKARDWWRSCADQDTDNSCIFEDAAKCAQLIGIDIRQSPVKLMGGGTRYEPTIYYSGFSSQGDGACFEGSYSYAKGAAKAIREHAPQDTVLHGIADELQAIQRKYFYRVEARMTHTGRSYHSLCMAVDVSLADTSGYDEPECAEGVSQCMRDFAYWIYCRLEAEYEYRMSDEIVDDCIEANGYEFDEDGSIA